MTMKQWEIKSINFYEDGKYSGFLIYTRSCLYFILEGWLHEDNNNVVDKYLDFELSTSAISCYHNLENLSTYMIS